MRPTSIIRFEQLYLGSLALWLVGKIAFWSATTAAVTRNPRVMSNPQLAAMIGPITLATIAIYGIVSVVLWYLVARRASVTGKWIVVVTEAIGALFAIGVLAGLARGTAPSVGDAIVGLIATALAIAAAVSLFKPDARSWLGEGAVGEAGSME